MQKALLYFLLTTLSIALVKGQHEALLVEAESGTVGGDYSILSDGSTSYAAIQTNGTSQTPDSIDRVISFDINFPDSGNYELYIRFRIGPDDFNDDSFFYGNGFGVKSLTDQNDWMTMNGLVTFGYVNPSDIVKGEGASSSEVWKWLNFSQFTGGEPPVTFRVDSANQTKTFQIGAREDGFEIDKIAFGRAGYFYTGTNLDNGESGSLDSMLTNNMVPIADGKFKFLGNVYSSSQSVEFANYWNQVTPENAGKWGSVEAIRDSMNWTVLDAAYALAQTHNFPFRFHVLVWGNQQPAWIENLPPAEQLEEIEEWFIAVSTRYPDVDYVEVVNEPLHDPPNSTGNGGGNYVDALGGDGASGWDWIVTAFTMAREHFPNAKLVINDYNIVSSTTNTLTYKQIIQLLQADSLIDVIGFQAHAFSTTAASSTMNTNLTHLASTGLPLMVTEMEIDGPSDQEQLEDYQRIFPLFWEHPSIIGITLWGFRPGMWRTDEMAYLIENDGSTERPAMVWLRNYVANATGLKGLVQNFPFMVYPNPVKTGTSLTIESEEGNHFIEQIQLFNLQGQLVWETRIERNIESSVVIPIDVSPGIYMVHLKGQTHFGSFKLSVN